MSAHHQTNVSCIVEAHLKVVIGDHYSPGDDLGDSPSNYMFQARTRMPRKCVYSPNVKKSRLHHSGKLGYIAAGTEPSDIINVIFSQAWTDIKIWALYADVCILQCTAQQAQNICIPFIQRWTNVEDVGTTLYKCYTNGLCNRSLSVSV